MKSRFLVTIVYFYEKSQKRVFSFHKGESCRAVVVQHRQLILNQDEKGCGYLFQIDSCREHDERKKMVSNKSSRLNNAKWISQSVR